MISGAIFFCIGFAVCYWWNKPTVIQQQETTANIGIIAKYIRDNISHTTTQTVTSTTKRKPKKVQEENSDPSDY